MTQPPADVRAVTEYRIPAPTLLPGDLVNTAPGSEDDWQQVLSVHTAETPGDDPDAAALIAEIGDRYVVVRLTDVAPVDSPVYFSDGAALAYGADGEEDGPVTEVLSEADAVRTFLYTRFELVNVRSRPMV
ncbi:hypothetical protein [Jatrophihabitans sp.]|jgi:hypothetical protein|uniref:hypothetical protein n=1 Tax=Jatrophihabitans sp. TaxID=1932789 RepID=UPI002EE270C9